MTGGSTSTIGGSMNMIAGLTPSNGVWLALKRG
jgi:hypothetical protein